MQRVGIPLLIALAFWVSFPLAAPVSGARAAQIELNANQITATWKNINGALIVVGASTAIDDDWTARFRAMEPDPAEGKTVDDLLEQLRTFHAKLNAVRQENSLEPIELRAQKNPKRLSSVFLASGQLMDGLILMLNNIDPLAFIAHYYEMGGDTDKTLNDAYMMAALANKRMDVYMEENGVELPQAEDAGADDAAPAGDGGN